MEKNIRKIVLIVGIILTAVLLRVGFEYAYRLINEIARITPIIGFLIRTLLLVFVTLIFLTIAIRGESAYQKLPWLIILIIEPLVGLFLYFSMGRSFKRSRRYKNRPLIHSFDYIKDEALPKTITYPENASSLSVDIFELAHKLNYHQPHIHNTKVELFQNGETFYPELLNQIYSAKSFILMEFFIFATDTRGKEILTALMEKAASGVKVKLIYDALGSNRRINRAFYKKLKASKVDLVINDPIYFPFFNTRVNYRNHRKIVVIDGKIAYTGGMNIADEYDNRITYDYYFHDLQVKLEGAAVKSLTSLFFKDYYYNTNRFIDDDFYYPKAEVSSSEIVQIIQSGPDSDYAFIRDTYVKMIMNAKQSIKIMTPYMALDQETLNALKMACLAGVCVDIIIPGKPDKLLVYKVTKYYAGVLLKHGASIHIYEKGFCHAKILIVDDEVASVGSYNFDNRSAVIDFEVTALFTGSAVLDVVKSFNQDKQDSRLLMMDEWRNRSIIHPIIEGVLSVFTPII